MPVYPQTDPSYGANGTIVSPDADPTYGSNGTIVSPDSAQANSYDQFGNALFAAALSPSVKQADLAVDKITFPTVLERAQSSL